MSNNGNPQRVMLPPPSRPRPIPLHQSSGVPFGHVPAYLPGSASLVEDLDAQVMVVLRDGKHIVGTLVSFDQYNNLILHNAVERRILRLQACYTDVPLGLYIVRGDSMVMAGRVSENNSPMKQVSLEEFENMDKETPLEWEFDLDLMA